jgi:GntR family transcriptional regulator
MTARKAIEHVEKDGLVERVPGKGTFVKKQHVTRGFFRVRPFKKLAEELGARPKIKLLESRVVKPPKHVSEKLQCGDQAIFVRRLQCFDEKPVRYAKRYLRSDLCAGILWENLEEGSIHEILVNKYNLPLTKVWQRMEATGLNKKNAALLEVKPGHPAFHIKRITYTFDQPVTYVEYFIRGEVAFEDTFSPQEIRNI